MGSCFFERETFREAKINFFFLLIWMVSSSLSLVHPTFYLEKKVSIGQNDFGQILDAVV